MLIPAGGAESRILDELAALRRTGLREMSDEGFEGKSLRCSEFVDLRYRGQSYELTVPFTRRFVSSFHKLHQRRYGHSDMKRPVEVVNVRSTFVGLAPKIRLPRMRKTRGRVRPLETTIAWFRGRRYPQTPLYDRGALAHGHVIKGPAIVGEYSATTLVPPDFVCTVDALGNLVLRLEE